MNSKATQKKIVSRRGIFPILGSALLIPFLGFGKPNKTEINITNENEYQTLLKPDGSTAKVKISTLKKSKIIQKNISNKSFLNWLGRKL